MAFEMLPPELREHLMEKLGPMDQFAVAEASPAMESIHKTQVAVGTIFNVEPEKKKIVIALTDMHCISSTQQALDHFEQTNIIISRAYVETESVVEFMKLLDWFERVTENGTKLICRIELIGRIAVCGGVVGILAR